jgi:hypothetical protein
MRGLSRPVLVCVAVLAIAPGRPLRGQTQAPAAATAAKEAALSTDEMRRFLLTADIVASRDTSTGITRPSRVTLSDGSLTHDALFQPVDEHEAVRKFDDGHVEINFIDSYKYDVAAYELAGLVGLEDMMPVTVVRTWQRRPGALSWWLPVRMDERTRLAQRLDPPAGAHWNDQMFRVRVFSALVADTDRNLTNILISEDWRVWMIDFTRAFRLSRTLSDAVQKDLARCDHALLDRLRALTRDEVARATDGMLSKGEIDALMARRDRIVEHFAALVARQGEASVLY